MTNYQILCNDSIIGAHFPASEGSVAVRFLGKIQFWYARSQQRDLLAQMEPRLLKDIGISAEQAQAEANKPYWKD